MIGKLAGKYVATKRDAVFVLSQLPQMLLLGVALDNSPARIAATLGGSTGHSLVAWRAIQTILVYFKVPTKLDEVDVEVQLEADATGAAAEFGDADVVTLVGILSEQARAYGLSAEFQRSVGCLFEPSVGSPFIPYLQALLYIATICDGFDHPPEYLYVFNPRGQVANRIFSTFPPELAAGGNPILNNFKAVDRLTYDWAESREDTREQAVALVGVVLGLGSLSFAARRQFSQTIRRAILRFIEVKSPAPVVLPTLPDLNRIERFVGAVAAEPTGTRGVIEQRLTDFLAALHYRGGVWRARGLGDPVNATNSSSRKLGDCDFQNVGERICRAVESHAGRLTDVYVAEHLRTLRLNLSARLEEWEAIADLAEWKLEVTFLVHEDARSGQAPGLALDVPCELTVITFKEFSRRVLREAGNDPRLVVEAFNRWIVDILNAPNTPHATKIEARELFAA